MSKEDLSKVLGRALLDHQFAETLHKDPAAAAKSMNAHLTHDELGAVKEVSAAHLATAATNIRKKLGAAAFFDQNQVQQAQMD